METELENLSARRMVLLTKSDQRTEALQLADSLRAAGAFVLRRLIDPFLFEYGSAALSLYLANGDHTRASEFLDEMTAGFIEAFGPMIPQEVMQEMTVGGLCGMMSPRSISVAVVSAIADGITEYPATRPMDMCASMLIEIAGTEADDAQRGELVGKLLGAAESLVANTNRYGFADEFAREAIRGAGTEGTIRRALATLRRIAENTASAGSWNTLCWIGSLWGQATEVMDACEQAVALAPDNGDIRDSRGLARALTGDSAGAIADFEAFVAWTSNSGAREQRQDWIEALRRGENPFTQELLEALRGQ